ncbi:MAG: aspartate/glutamate racemase family protein [Paracoccaceae bacterium]
MTVMLEHLPFETDAGIGARARLGLIALATDYTIEHEYRVVLARLPGVAQYTSRIPMDPHVTPGSLAAMEAGIKPSAAILLPGDSLDAVAYGCTSASMIIGPERVTELVREAKPGVEVATPITAAMAALGHFAARRIGVLTPYTRDVNTGIQTFIENAGFEVPVFGSFNEPSDPVVGAISPVSIRKAVLKVVETAEVDAVFVSCTSLRLVEHVAALEAELDLPVTSSNHALIWQSLRLAGIEDRLDGLGKLFA